MSGKLLSLTLGKKFFASFGGVLVLLLGITRAAFWATANMARSTHEIADMAAVKAETAATLSGLAAYIHESQTRFVLTRNASYADHLGDVATQQVAASARQLADAAEALSGLVAHFKIAG